MPLSPKKLLFTQIDSNIDELKDDIVLLNEEDVDYDLLDRSKVINQLYNAIIMANPDGRFVISLEGKWGSGKTTIIKNVKKMIFENEDNIVVIDEFDPWTYSDEEALLINMFNIIIQKSGFKYSTFFTKRLAEDLSEIVLGTNKKGVIKSIFFQNSAINLKAKINSYLRLSGKKFVFFIDNLDRAEKDNVILLFKLVGNVLDFERVTYVLSFDDKRVKEIFREDLSIDYEYLKKIIQLQIRVPEIDKNVLNKIYDTSLKKLLIIYGESKDNFNEYNPIIDIICRQKLDIRDFKRFINSVLSSSFRINHYLYKRDLLVIEYIRLFNLPLYLTIYDNKQYFVSHDQMFDKDIYYDTFNREEFNSKGKAFFEKLFADIENKIYIDILAELFPYVNKYKIGQELIYTGNIIARDIEYPRISKCKRICSAKYFDLYFTDTNNAFIIIAGLVEKFVEDMNESQSFVDREAVFQNMLKSVHYSYHKEIFERIQLYLEDLEKGCIFDFVKILFQKSECVDNSLVFLSLNARNRAIIIMHELLNKISDEEYKLFLEDIRKEYKKLQVLQGIIYWFEHDREEINIDGRRESFEKIYQEMGADILVNNINLYNDFYYMDKNIWSLYNIYREEQQAIKRYINAIANETNIFRILNDAISTSHGTSYRYSINKENLNILITEEEIDKILNNTKPSTEDEKFVLEVYKSYKNNIQDEWGETGITLFQEKRIQL